MGDVGIQISQPFKSVDSAADYEFLFNSAYPSLSVAYEETVTTALATSGNTILPTITHNLGYVPLTMMWTTLGDTSSTNMVDFRYPYITSTQAYGDTFSLGSFSDPTTGAPYATDQTAYFHFKCYNVDMTVQKTYDFIKIAGASVNYDPDIGMKIAKEGKDIDSGDMRDFILHTRCQAPLLLSVVTQESQQGTPGNFTITYNNPSGYTPWVFGFASNTSTDSQYDPAYLRAGSPPRMYFNNASSFTVNYQGSKAALVVLRDPLFAATDLNVSY